MSEITETVYIRSATSLQDRLTKICNIIDALEERELEAAGNVDIDEYSLDDGQVKIRTLYRDPNSIARAIELLERRKIKILNQLNGRQMALRDHRGLVIPGYYPI